MSAGVYESINSVCQLRLAAGKDTISVTVIAFYLLNTGYNEKELKTWFTS